MLLYTDGAAKITVENCLFVKGCESTKVGILRGVVSNLQNQRNDARPIGHCPE
jgi:hypothetical protein